MGGKNLVFNPYPSQKEIKFNKIHGKENLKPVQFLLVVAIYRDEGGKKKPFKESSYR